MRKGRFLSFEGIDGSGLTTQALLLKNWLQDKGYETYLTKEPTDGPAGLQIRLALSGRLSLTPETLALLFAADRMDHLQNDIIPKIENGVIVICDRYFLSSYAYQSLDLELEWVERINSKCMFPDLIFILDAPVLVCRRRMQKQRWHIELYEEEKKLESIRKNYLRIAEDMRRKGKPVEVVDGNRPKAEVHKDILRILRARKVLQDIP